MSQKLSINVAYTVSGEPSQASESEVCAVFLGNPLTYWIGRLIYNVDWSETGPEIYGKSSI